VGDPSPSPRSLHSSAPPFFFSPTSHSFSLASCTRSACEYTCAHPPSQREDPRQADDHAARLARFAISAMAAAGEVPVDEEGPDPAARVQIRIGMHCGPVSASVVGTQVQARVVIALRRSAMWAFHCLQS
jgi:class 3 adenylate cyclase